ncbi:MAG TPA: hypothetical protein VE865_12835, partial [Bradyrhizobium sp.]|nr:hypothetical protein [Bradyrhizobium sp.]
APLREPGIHNHDWGLWIPGLRHPSPLLPSWTMIMPNSGKPEFGWAHPGMTALKINPSYAGLTRVSILLTRALLK